MSDRSLLRRALREPLLHFVLLAALLFGVSALFGRDQDVIDITRDEIEWRIEQIEAQEGSTLTDEERSAVEERVIDERVLVREAESMGLTDDQQIDDILIQKMLHVLSGDVIQPTDEELEAYFAMNPELYRTPESVTVDELVVRKGDPLPAELREGGEPEYLPDDAIVGHRIMPRLERDALVQLFGEESADEIFGAQQGEWVQAYESVRGLHWFRVRERFEAETPTLDEVRDVVRLDWVSQQEDRRLLSRVAELRDRYTIRVEGEGER